VLFSILTFHFTFLALVTLVLASIVAYQNSRC
jgi:hypothetical protein